MKYDNIDNRLFIDNRSRFVKKLKDNALAIIFGNSPLPENGDAHVYYKANSDLFWLTGIEQEKTSLLIFPQYSDPNLREVLVILRPNIDLEKWEGHKLSKEEASQLSGIKTVIYEDQMPTTLQVMMHRCELVYVNSNENDRLDYSMPRLDLIPVRALMRKYPLHRFERTAPILRRLRQVKNKYEVDLIQKATNITHKAFERVMSYIKPGVMEYEIEAEITHEFLVNKATRHAYGCILASGDNARILHYVDNNQQCKDGDLILMDFGAEYANYASDLTRTIPVNGKYTKRQKEVYDACLAVHNYAKSLIKHGQDYQSYLAKVNVEMEKQLLKIGLLSAKEIKNQDPANPAYRQYFYHGLGHHMGIDVHDIGWYHEKMEAGMVLTVEPGIYIEQEGIGVRIENDVLVTKTGINDFFKNIPITTTEIEAYMKKNARK